MSDATPLDGPDEPLPGLSVQEAADISGVSVGVMRQWCATGRVRTEHVTRGSVHTIRVHLDPPPTQAPGPSGASVAADGPEARGSSRPPTDVTAIAAESQAMPALADVLSKAPGLLAPFVTELTAAREAGERRAADLRAQAELIGRLSSELDAARATLTEMVAREQQSELRARHAVVALMVALTVAVVAVSVAAAVWFGR